MPSVARLGDNITCGDIICEGSGNVFAEGIPIARATQDLTCGHCFNPTQIASGSPTVFVNNKPMARLGDPIVVHFCGPANHGGTIASGAATVFADS